MIQNPRSVFTKLTSSLNRIRKLEEENQKLRAEIVVLRSQKSFWYWIYCWFRA